MNKSLIMILTVSGALASGLAQAGNYPISARTLTSGIGGGTQAAGVPSSHPYTTRSQGFSYSGRSRNPAAMPAAASAMPSTVVNAAAAGLAKRGGGGRP